MADDTKGTLASLKVQMDKKRRIKTKNDLKIGDIIEMEMDAKDGLTLNDEYDTRRKFVVIVGKTSNGDLFGAYLINSRIDFRKRNEEMMKYQYPMLQKNYPELLEYDSWLDCTDMFDLRRRKIVARKAKHISHLTCEDEINIKEIVFNSELITEKMKKKLGIISHNDD